MIDSSPYDLKDFPGSSHWMLIRAVRRHPGLRGTLVDVGAAGGEVSARLRDHFSFRIGVEGDPARIPGLRRAFDAAVITDLASTPRLPAADAFLLADILEHLPRPTRLLDLVREALRPDGRVFLSVPNVANITVRLGLLLGRWDYTDRGILDRTHLRFYTRKTILRELEMSGFETIRIEATTMPIRLVLEGKIPEFVLRSAERVLLALTRVLPSLLGYQWIITASRR